MSAQIYNIRDYQNPRDLERLKQQQVLEHMAAEVFIAAIYPATGLVPTHWPPSFSFQEPVNADTT